MANLPDITNVTSKAAVQQAANTFVPIQWSDEILAEREKQLFAARFFKRFNHRGKRGDTIRIPLITRASTTDRTAGVAMIPTINSEGKIDVVIDKDKYIYRFFDKFLEMQSKYDLRSEYQKVDAYAMAEKIDTDILALFNANLPAAYKVIGTDGVTQYSNAAGGNQANLTDAGILACMKALLNNNVNLDECAWFIPPSQYTAMLAIDKFVLFQHSGEKRVMTGDIGQIYGIPVKVTNNCETTDAARVAVLAHKDSVCSVVQQDVTVEAQYQLPYRAWGVAQSTCYGVKGLRLDADNTSSSNHRIAEAIAVYVP